MRGLYFFFVLFIICTNASGAPLMCSSFVGRGVSLTRSTNSAGFWHSFTKEDISELESLVKLRSEEEWNYTNTLGWGSVELLYVLKFLSGEAGPEQKPNTPGSVQIFVSRLEGQLRPRIAILFREDSIYQVLGFWRNQHLDTEIARSSVLLDFLKENHIPENHYLTKMARDENRLAEIVDKDRKGEALSEGELRFLYQIDRPLEQGFGYRGERDEDGMREAKATLTDRPLGNGENPMREAVISRRSISQDLANVFHAQRKDVLLHPGENLHVGHKVVYGDYVIHELTQGQPVPEIVVGDFYFTGKILENVDLPRIVTGRSYIHATTATNVAFHEQVGIMDLVNLTQARNVKLPARAHRIALRKLENHIGVTFPTEVAELWISENLITHPIVLQAVREMSISDTLTILETRIPGLNSELNNFQVPEIEGGRYEVHADRMFGVIFPEHAKSVIITARTLNQVELPRLIEETLMVEHALVYLGVRMPTFTGGDALLSGLALHHNSPLLINASSALQTVGGKFEGPPEFKPRTQSF